MIVQEDCIVVGKITKTHNLQGEVVVSSDNDFLEKYAGEPLFILLDGGPVPFFIEDDGLTVRNHLSYIVKFEFVDSLAKAERLIGCDVMIESSLIDDAEVEEDDFSVFDLVGFTVQEQNSGGTGEVTDVADYSGNIVLSVNILGKEVLFPFSETYIQEIDFENGNLFVKIPAELIELN